MLLAVLISIAAPLILSRIIIRPLSRTDQIARGIADGDLNQTVDIVSQDEGGQLGRSLSLMPRNLKRDIGATRRMADETLRTELVLDNVSSSVMMADNQRKTFFMSNSAHQLFREAEQDIQQDLRNYQNQALIDQVMPAVTSMDQKPQQNAALAEQTSAASASPTHEASELNEIVSRFRV